MCKLSMKQWHHIKKISVSLSVTHYTQVLYYFSCRENHFQGGSFAYQDNTQTDWSTPVSSKHKKWINAVQLDGNISCGIFKINQTLIQIFKASNIWGLSPL